MQIPQSRPDLGPREMAAVTEVMESTMLSLGPRVRAFEQTFRDRLSVPHALAVSSGTAGLHLCIRAFEIGEGDEVITTPFSFVASANCVEFERAVPRFVDIDPQTLNIDAARIEAAITPRTKAILPVHVFGLPADMDAIGEIARKHGLKVIEDSCEALGASWRGRPAGTLGDAAVFAFYPNKQITCGEGGMIVTQDARAASLMDSMRNQGRADDGGWLRHERLGYNYRLDELSSAIGEVQMQRLDELLGLRSDVAGRYDRLLGDVEGVTIPYRDPAAEVSWFVYVVRLDGGIDRDEVMRRLGDRGVQCRPYFPSIHLQPYYVNKYGFKRGDFPITEDVSGRTLSLPFFGRLQAHEQEYVRDALVAVLRETATPAAR